MKRQVFRSAAKVLGYGTGVLIITVAACVYLYTERDPAAALRSRMSPLESSTVTEISRDSLTVTYSVQLHSRTLPEINCYLRLPAHRRLSPVVILVGGLNTGRDSISLVGTSGILKDIVFMTLDYPYPGKKKNLSLFETVVSLPAIRKSALDTVPAIILMVDFLSRMPEVNPEQIFVVGVSFGMFFTTAAAALDTRIRAAMSFFGAGNIADLMTHNFPRGPRILRRIAGWGVQFTFQSLEPLAYAGMIAPRHYLMVNGREDELLPEKDVLDLFETAGEPKELIWLDTLHIQGFRHRIISELTRIAVEFLTKNRLIDLPESSGTEKREAGRPHSSRNDGP